MELSSIYHINSENLADCQADIFVTTLSHEIRCQTIARKMERLSCRKIALTKTDGCKEYAFKENQAYYQAHGFEIIPVSTDVPDVREIVKEVSTKEIRFIFDCTCMSQQWYYEFFRWFGEIQDLFSIARLRFVYSMAGYESERSPRKVKRIEEFLKNEERRTKPKKALILGLGHEANVSESIWKIEKPDLLYLFYADPPVDKRFVEQLFINNHALINETPIRNLVAYPINNGQVIYQTLINTILPLRNDYSITLIPQGPKIFSVASMLVHMGYPDTKISYPVFKNSPMMDRQSCGEPVVLDAYFEGDE